MGVICAKPAAAGHCPSGSTIRLPLVLVSPPMEQADVTALVAMLADGRVDVDGVGAFWQQVRRARIPGARQPVVAVPVTFHLTGELRSIAYAQLLAGPGLQEARDHTP